MKKGEKYQATKDVFCDGCGIKTTISRYSRYNICPDCKEKKRVEYMADYHQTKKKTWNRRVPKHLTESNHLEIAEAIGGSHQSIQQLEISALKKVERAFKRPELCDWIDF